MSLIIAYVDSRSAIIGGDRRSIIFTGKSLELEDELYSGSITKDEDLLRRASELGAFIKISDGRDKVWREGDVLIGEVSEISIESQRRRRIYATPGEYILVDIDCNDVAIRNRGKSGLIILGNKFAKSFAADNLKAARIDRSLFDKIFTDVAKKTASVSPGHSIFHTETRISDPNTLILNSLQKNCKDNGWKICGLE